MSAQRGTSFFIILAYAVSACSRGKVSVRGFTPAIRLNAMVSSESIALPLGQPATVRPLSSANGEIASGSPESRLCGGITPGD